MFLSASFSVKPPLPALLGAPSFLPLNNKTSQSSLAAVQQVCEAVRYGDLTHLQGA